MTLHTRQSLMGGACVCSLAFSPAAAEQPLSDSEEIERLERQTELLQKQLKALKPRSRRQKRGPRWYPGRPATRRQRLAAVLPIPLSLRRRRQPAGIKVTLEATMRR